MMEFNDNDLTFVASRYMPDHFDTRKAISRFRETNKETTHRRWWMTAAAAAASIVLVLAAGYGIRSWVRNAHETTPAEQLSLNPNVADTHFFIYNNAPLYQVLAELSAYYHCTLTAPDTDKCLTATFPDDDVELIVATIESALQIPISLER